MKNIEKLIEDMKACPQTSTQSVYEHGVSVRDYVTDLITFTQNQEHIPKYEWKLPDWFIENREFIASKLLSLETIQEYALYHDCGKHYCLTIDSEGKKHFPNHAEVSYHTYLEHFNNQQVADLIKMDMDIHLLKSEQIEEFTKRPEAITLLITGLAEIHSNAAMFGGIQSTNFKIKWKHIEKRGRQIITLLRQMRN